MKLPYLLVDAFTRTPGTGNRVAVFPDARGLGEDEATALVSRLGVREAALVTGGGSNVFEVRYLTPEGEIEFAGAATIALALVLLQEGLAEAGSEKLFFRTPGETVPVEIRYRGDEPVEAVMREPAPRFRDPPTYAQLREVMEALGADERYLHRGLPVGTAYAGLWSLFLPMVAPGMVDALEPDLERLAELSQRLGVATFHPYAPMGPRTYYARDFAPALGIPEDPVTGSANGALAALLARAGVVPRREGEVVITVLQGHHLGVPGEVRVRVEYTASGEPYAVYVGGGAAIVERGVLER